MALSQTLFAARQLIQVSVFLSFRKQ